MTKGRAQSPTESVLVRRWGSETALIDDDEARRRLLAAAARRIVERGGIQFRMGEVAETAGVARSTLYRYFQSRDQLIVELMLSRVGSALAAAVSSLRVPGDARRSLPELILQPLDLVAGNPLNEALFSADSGPVVSALQLRSESLIELLYGAYGNLLEAWQADGQLQADLEIRETLRWMNAVSLILLGPPWRDRSRRDKATFLHRYLVRALVVG